MAVTAGQTGYVTVAFGFTGKLFEVYTGLQNSWHRWYDPAVGRWVSEDWIPDDPSNTYRYVGNAPTMYVDPSGLAPNDVWPDLQGRSWNSDQDSFPLGEALKAIYESYPELQDAGDELKALGEEVEAAAKGLLEETPVQVGLAGAGIGIGGLFLGGGLNELTGSRLPSAVFDIPLPNLGGKLGGRPWTAGGNISGDPSSGGVGGSINIGVGLGSGTANGEWSYDPITNEQKWNVGIGYEKRY